MPETSYIREYTDGELTAEIPYEVSDEELYQEQLDYEFNAAHEVAIKALNNWGKLTNAQKDVLLKNLVKWALWKDGWLKSGVL